MELTIQDCQNAIVFLERVDLKGKEAQAHTELLMKIRFLGQKLADAELAAQKKAPPPAPVKAPVAVEPDEELPIDEPLPELDEE